MLQINALKASEHSVAVISRHGRNRTAISSYIQGTLKSIKKRSGRPRKIFARDERRIVILASNAVKSLREITAECGWNVSRDTVNRVLTAPPPTFYFLCCLKR